MNDKVKSLTAGHHPIEGVYLARKNRQEADVTALHAIANPTRVVPQHGFSAAASATTPYRGSHGGMAVI